jgi:hypothetical protein
VSYQITTADIILASVTFLKITHQRKVVDEAALLAVGEHSAYVLSSHLLGTLDKAHQ